MEKYMNKKVGMYASIITFLGALCFSINIPLFLLFYNNTFRIGNHLSCIFIALGFIAMICSYVAFIKDENKSVGLISLAFSIIYVIVIVILSIINIGIIPDRYSNLSNEIKDILYNLEILGYTFMAMSSFFIGIKLETKNKKELFLKLLLCFQIVFSIIWFISLVNFVYHENMLLLMFEIWCLYTVLICIFSFLYFKNK
jgi:hypothetical protein